MNAVLAPGIVKLTYQSGQVLVEPGDEDRFVLSAEKAMDACLNAIRREERIKTFKEKLLLPFYEWCLKHSAIVAECYIPYASGSFLKAFIVTKSKKFDFVFADNVADFERELNNNGWRINLTQLPLTDEPSFATYFNPDGALEVYAHRRSASH